jgi:restriction system protein
MRLTEEDRADLIPSGGTSRFARNVEWARHYLKRAGALEVPARGATRITDRGRSLLLSGGERIDMRVLAQFPEFREFRSLSRREAIGSAAPSEAADDLDETESELAPEEVVRIAAATIRARVIDELLDQVRSQSPAFFELLVLKVLTSAGYGHGPDAARHLGRSSDGGVDGVISQDQLGLDLVYVQAKKWQNTVGRPDIQAFVGSLEEHHATKGVFITTSTFSREAHDAVKAMQKRIALIDGEELGRLMYESGIGVTLRDEYQIKELDSDFFPSG